MKRILLVVATLLVCVSLSAQNKGEMFIAPTIGASFGSQNSKFFDGVNTTTDKKPMTTSLSGQGEFGYFVANNLRLAFDLGVSFSTTPNAQIGSRWLRSNTVSFMLNPNVAYYVRLADRLYYTPEIGVFYEFGFNKEDLTTSTTDNTRYSGWGLYTNLLALEYRVNQKIAIGVIIGGLDYSSMREKSNDVPNVYSDHRQFVLDLNSASVSVYFYL
jgi:hypothetical protein